jgi:hypothetical protein
VAAGDRAGAGDQLFDRRVRQFGYAWLLAFMTCLSLALGALFLVLVHHLFDAGWSVPIRRVCEHLACLSAPVMAVLWIPIGLLAFKLYPWMARPQAHPDHASTPSGRCSPTGVLPGVVRLLWASGTWWRTNSARLSWNRTERRGGLHPQPCGAGRRRHFPVRRHAELRRHFLDEGVEPRLVFDDVRRLLLFAGASG